MSIYANVFLPEYVYHGTVSSALPGLTERLLNRDYWNPKRDFGAGFYTTFSLNQAKAWAEQMVEENSSLIFEDPLVLKIRCRQDLLLEPVKTLIFTGPSREWSDFILDHRIRASIISDPCQDGHPDIVVGLLADNRTSSIVEEFQRSKKLSKDWFYDQICRDMDRDSIVLDAIELGNQICFCNENLMDILRIDGYYISKGRRESYEYIPFP